MPQQVSLKLKEIESLKLQISGIFIQLGRLLGCLIYEGSDEMITFRLEILHVTSISLASQVHYRVSKQDLAFNLAGVELDYTMRRYFCLCQVAPHI